MELFLSTRLQGFLLSYFSSYLYVTEEDYKSYHLPSHLFFQFSAMNREPRLWWLDFWEGALSIYIFNNGFSSIYQLNFVHLFLGKFSFLSLSVPFYVCALPSL